VLRWSLEEKKAAEDYAHEVLKGAGVYGREVTEFLPATLHVRRETTGEERDAFFKSPEGRRVAGKHQRGTE